MAIFDELQKMGERPEPYQYHTTAMLWTDDHISGKMLELHLDDHSEMSSRNSAFIQRSTDWIISRFQVGPGTRVCDFGCGPGLYTTRLAQAGAAVTGVDFSPRSIAHARQSAEDRGLAIDYICQDYLELPAKGRFDLITMIYCDFCALSPAQRAGLLQKWREMLVPGGAVLLDVFSLKFFAAAQEKRTYEYSAADGFWAAGPYHAFLNTFKYPSEKVVLDKWTIVEPMRTRVIYNWLQCYNPEDLARELSSHGLLVQEQLANVAGDPYGGDTPEFAVAAVKQ